MSSYSKLVTSHLKYRMILCECSSLIQINIPYSTAQEYHGTFSRVRFVLARVVAAWVPVNNEGHFPPLIGTQQLLYAAATSPARRSLDHSLVSLRVGHVTSPPACRYLEPRQSRPLQYLSRGRC